MTESVLVEPMVSAADAMSELVAVIVEDTAGAVGVLRVITVVMNLAVDISTIVDIAAVAFVVIRISLVVSDVDGALVFISAVDWVSVVTESVDVSIE